MIVPSCVALPCCRGRDVKKALGTFLANDDGPFWDASLDYFQWSNAAYQARKKQSNTGFDILIYSWIEQRNWAIKFALEALPPNHPIRAQYKLLGYSEDSNHILPEYNHFREDNLIESILADGYSEHKPHLSVAYQFNVGQLSLGVDPNTGGIAHLSHADTLYTDYGSSPSYFGVLNYQTFTEKDFDDYLLGYGKTVCLLWNFKFCHTAQFDYGKNNMSNANPEHFNVYPSLTNIFSKAAHNYRGIEGLERLDIVEVLDFNSAELVQKYGAPQKVLVHLFINNAENDLNYEVFLINKTETRLGESVWLQFKPVFPVVQKDSEIPQWHADKLGSWVNVNPSDVIMRGSSHLHAVTSGMKIRDLLHFSSPDIALMGIGDVLNPFPSPLAPQYTHGIINTATNTAAIGFNIFNNIWGTNYIMSYPYLDNERSTRFRVRVQLNRTSAA
jgi:hypothetical protein